jgi:hypothetical protein
VQVAIEVQQKSLLVVHPCVDDAERGFAGEGGSLCVGGFALADSLSVAVRKWLPPRLCRSAAGHSCAQQPSELPAAVPRYVVVQNTAVLSKLLSG